MKRRKFVFATAATLVTTKVAQATTVAATPFKDKIVVGVIGLGSQGRAHLKSYLGIPNVEVAYICDLDSARLAEGAKMAPNSKSVSDLRRILDDRLVDAVSIATPDHWHTPASLLALAAGKHVYVEKPCSHNVAEGRFLVEAARRTGRIVQHGTQSRSTPFIQAAMQHLRDGIIGTVEIARAWDVQFRAPIGRAKPTSAPEGFDYETWVGPAPMVPFQSNRHHYNWHWWYDFGTGDAGNDGVHEMDIARWGLGVETHPSQVAAIGGKYVHDDDQQFPDTITAAYEYPGDGTFGTRRQLTFEMRLWSKYNPHKIDNGNEFLGTKGRMLLTKRGRVEVYNEKDELIPIELPDKKSAGIAHHQINFIEAIRTGVKPNADAMTGHLSASLSHFANMACRIGRSFRFEPTAEKVIGDDECNQLLARQYREHWGSPNGL